MTIATDTKNFLVIGIGDLGKTIGGVAGGAFITGWYVVAGLPDYEIAIMTGHTVGRQAGMKGSGMFLCVDRYQVSFTGGAVTADNQLYYVDTCNIDRKACLFRPCILDRRAAVLRFISEGPLITQCTQVGQA